MANNKPETPGPAFGRSSKPYAPGEKPGVNATGPGPNMESVPTPRNTAVDLATQPDPITGEATTPGGRRLQSPGAPNKGRAGMPPDPVPNPHIPSSTAIPILGPNGLPMTTSSIPEVDPEAEAAADKIVDELEDEPHPEHVAGKVAVKQVEARKNAEHEAGKKAMERHPHRNR